MPTVPRDPRTAPVTKSEFMAWRECPEEAWLDRHVPAAIRAETAGDRLSRENGRAVDELARTYLATPGAPERLFGGPGRLEFQETYTVPGRWLVRTDLVFHPADGSPATLVEVKASTVKADGKGRFKPEPDHLADLAFQRMVLRAEQVEVQRCGLLLLSGDYCLGEGELDLECLFAYREATGFLDAPGKKGQASIAEQVALQALEALTFLQGSEPEPWSYTACANKSKCRWLQRSFELPRYSVFDIARISPVTLAALLDQRVIDVQDVPDHVRLSDKQRRQVRIAQEGIRHCDQDAVDALLGAHPYPHYFLDYETLGLAVPELPGMSPYEHLVFQYSLHVQRDAGAPCEHYECLLEDRSAGALPLLRHLREHLPAAGGTVFVWFEQFERGRNEDMARLHPEFAAYLHGVNARVYDLMRVFASEVVEDPDFRGSASIKRVLPALVPALSYAELPIQEGLAASHAWKRLTRGTFPRDEVATVRADLLDYCRLDTLAMVELHDWATRPTPTHAHSRF